MRALVALALCAALAGCATIKDQFQGSFENHPACSLDMKIMFVVSEWFEWIGIASKMAPQYAAKCEQLMRP